MKHEREQFHEWLKSKGHWPNTYAASDVYLDRAHELAWEAWQERGKQDRAQPEWLSQALNEGDGVYRP